MNQSASVNKAQLVGETNGNVIVPMYDWNSHFAVSFKKIVGIKGYHHFKADAASPGKVLLCCVAHGPVTEVNILKHLYAMISHQWYHQKVLQVKGNGTCMIKSVERNVKILLVLSQKHHDQ